MKKYFLTITIFFLAANLNAQIIKEKFPKVSCTNALPLQQIGGPSVVVDKLLVYQVCINPSASDNANPQIAKHLVGAVKVSNNSKSTYQVRVYYFWKGNQVNTTLVNINPNGFQLYPFNLLAKKGKENENSLVEVRSEQTKKILSVFK